jgi:hypothetical protein
MYMDSEASLFDNQSQVHSFQEPLPPQELPSFSITSNSQSQDILSSSCSSSASSVLAFRYVESVNHSQSCCFLCKSKVGRKSIPWSAVRQAWFKFLIYIPKSNRLCSSHLNSEKLFTDEALLSIQATKQGIHVKSYDFGLWLHQVCEMTPNHILSFEGINAVPVSKYKTYTGIEKIHFDNLHSCIESRLRNTHNRSSRNALAMLLMVLRNNVTQEFVASLFNTTQRIVSASIDSVCTALSEEFVPQYLGYLHLTREEALERHSVKLTNGVLGEDSSHLCVMADATYCYIEQPSDFVLQKKTFSMHKKRNLLKPLLIVFPSGHILEAAGPFFCDSSNNDAACMKYHYDNSDLFLFLEDEDFFIFDRGFRDAVEETTSNGFTVYMPSLLDQKRKSFTSEEANESRKVRIYIVEYLII